jgi:hypothetical protein
MNTKTSVCVMLLAVSLSSALSTWSQSGSDSQPSQPGRIMDLDNLHLQPTRSSTGFQTESSEPNVVAASTTAKPKVYKFATADYPGAALSVAFDISSGGTAVGVFNFNPRGTPPPATPTTGFTVRGNVYQTFTIPGSTVSALTGINSFGNMVGAYGNSLDALHGLLDVGGTITNIAISRAQRARILMTSMTPA